MATPDNVTKLPTSVPRKQAAAEKPKATAKKTAAKKATAKKAPPKAKSGDTPRTKSTVSKEGEKTDAFTGETLPVTAFPTVRQKDGSYIRGEVARKNLAAWREDKRAKREAAKAEEAKAKAEKKATAKPAAKKATAKKATAKKATAKKATAPAAKKADDNA